MIGMFSGKNLYLLQLQWGRIAYKQDDPTTGYIFLIIIVAVVLLVIAFHFIRNGMSSSVAGKDKSHVTPRKFKAFTLYRIASAYGLDREQTKLLEYVFRTASVNDPERVMSNPALLDRHFKRAYRAIERNSESDTDVQQRLVRLFSLRNVIEASAGTGDSYSTKLAENTPAVLAIEQESYPVKLISSRGQIIITEIPRNALGTPVRIVKGTRVSLSFFTKSSKGFSFEGHVMGSLDTDHGPGLQISHSGKAKPLVKRMYRRKQASKKCEFSFVHLDESQGKKKPPKLIVDTKKFIGTVMDISIGGCALKTTAPVQVGSRLKLIIDCDDDSLINVLGQVLRTNRSGASGSIVHIKFLKVPRRAFNSISALVFGYNED